MTPLLISGIGDDIAFADFEILSQALQHHWVTVVDVRDKTDTAISIHLGPIAFDLRQHLFDRGTTWHRPRRVEDHVLHHGFKDWGFMEVRALHGPCFPRPHAVFLQAVTLLKTDDRSFQVVVSV
jgi:hypothetical protein